MKPNYLKLEFLSLPENQAFARDAVAAFCLPLNPTLSQLSDVKTAVSEAVTNCIIHGYGGKAGKIRMNGCLKDRELTVEIIDEGCGIKDVEKAMEPLYTSRPDLERSGMGFAFMEAFMDELKVASAPGKGTRVWMKKRLQKV